MALYRDENGRLRNSRGNPGVPASSDEFMDESIGAGASFPTGNTQTGQWASGGGHPGFVAAPPSQSAYAPGGGGGTAPSVANPAGGQLDVVPIELLALQQQAAYQAASLATQKEIASMEIASRQALSQQEMALQRELQAGNIDLQKYLQQRELAQRESEFSRTYVIQQAQQKLQELRFEFDKQLAAATLRANPRDWVANAYFQRGLKPGDPMLGGQTARTDEELRNMPWLRSIQTNQALPKFQAPAGQVGEGGPFGIEALSPLQITAPVWNSLSNVEREMAGGAVSAQGQDPADFFARMYASQIRGRAGPGQFSVN